MNVYNLSRDFWDFAFDNPEKIKPNHIAVYFFSIEHCNRLGWKKNFGLPTTMTMEAVGIKSYSVYKRTFDDLADFGFFKIIQFSKNQYTANVIALKEYYKADDKANNKALDKAITKHIAKHERSTLQSTDESTHQRIDSINKPLNNIPLNLQTNKEDKILCVEDSENDLLKNELVEALVKEFGFTDSKFSNQRSTILSFVKNLFFKNSVEHFIKQMQDYKEYKNLSGEKLHSFRTMIGTQKEQFEDGQWNAENWENKTANFTARDKNAKPGINEALQKMNLVTNPFEKPEND